MLIPLKAVPANERHLLFCSHPAVMRPRRRPVQSAIDLEALNRSLAIHDAIVDELLSDDASIAAEDYPCLRSHLGAA